MVLSSRIVNQRPVNALRRTELVEGCCRCFQSDDCLRINRPSHGRNSSDEAHQPSSKKTVADGYVMPPLEEQLAQMSCMPLTVWPEPSTVLERIFNTVSGALPTCYSENGGLGGSWLNCVSEQRKLPPDRPGVKIWLQVAICHTCVPHQEEFKEEVVSHTVLPLKGECTP